MKKKMLLIGMVTMMICAGTVMGCGQSADMISDGETQKKVTMVTESVQEVSKETEKELAEKTGGILCISVNPEIAVYYDAGGLVTKIDARNNDGNKILEGYKDFEGKECGVVVSEIINSIGQAGYLVEEIEGEKRQIIIEIEDGSVLPNEEFLDDVVKKAQVCVTENEWVNPISVEGTSAYGMSEYGITDYEEIMGEADNYESGSYETSDYEVSDYETSDYEASDYETSDYEVSDYETSDYEASDYETSDYEVSDYETSDYEVSDYETGDYEVSDYETSDYEVSDYETSDYEVSDYETSDYEVSDYETSDYEASDYGNSDYDD